MLFFFSKLLKARSRERRAFIQSDRAATSVERASARLRQIGLVLHEHKVGAGANGEFVNFRLQKLLLIVAALNRGGIRLMSGLQRDRGIFNLAAEYRSPVLLSGRVPGAIAERREPHQPVRSDCEAAC